jgi:hypothetical protein
VLQVLPDQLEEFSLEDVCKESEMFGRAVEIEICNHFTLMNGGGIFIVLDILLGHLHRGTEENYVNRN